MLHEVAHGGFGLAFGPAVPAQARVQWCVFAKIALSGPVDRHGAQMDDAAAIGFERGLHERACATANRRRIPRHAVHHGIEAFQGLRQFARVAAIDLQPAAVVSHSPRCARGRSPGRGPQHLQQARAYVAGSAEYEDFHAASRCCISSGERSARNCRDR